MIRLAFLNLIRRPLRLVLTVIGLALATAILASLSAFSSGYRRALATELDRTGVQVMLVPLGCPYDAAARVLKGKNLENSLPAAALEAARSDPAVSLAAPMLMVAAVRQNERRTDMWVGIDSSTLQLKPWWQAKSGDSWFKDPNSVVLGSEAAAIEMRSVGDKLYNPESSRTLRVTGILERSGTSDDSLFFVPLSTAQEMFAQPGSLTAIAIRLKDPALMREALERLQRIPGAQVVSLTEMMGTFLNLVGAVRTLVTAIIAVAITAATLGLLNTLMAAVIERETELSLMRAIGASRKQVFLLIGTESLLLALAGTTVGVILAGVLGTAVENAVKSWVPLAPSGSLLSLNPKVIFQCALMAVSVGAIAGMYPAWRGSRLQPAVAAKME